MNTGLTSGVSWSDYRQLNYMNGSLLSHGAKSMKALRNAIDGNAKEPTDPMRLGSGTHCLLLEPDEFEERFCVVPDFHLDADNLRAAKNKSETIEARRTESKATKYYGDKIKEFAAANSGKQFLSRDQYDKCLHAIEAFHSHPEASAILQASGTNREVTIIGEILGVPFKGRLDLLTPKEIPDLKTTISCDPVAFGRSFANLNYGMKLAIYHDLVRQNIAERPVSVIAQEVDGDFDTCVFDVPSGVLESGLATAHRILADYKHAIKNGEWHGVDRGETRVPLWVPNWAMKDEPLVAWSDSPTVGQSIDETEVAF